MASQSGLPPKVIKHWFRNTLFKERQRNKDSPYNFNNPPCTTLNLEEYEKTGEAKVVSLPPDGSEMNQIELTCPDEHIKDDENRIHSENKNSDCKHPNLEDSQELPLRILSPARSLMSQNSRAESPSTIPSRMTNSSSPMLPPKIVAQNHNDPICGASHAHTTTFSLAANHEANSPIISSELMHNGLSNSSSNGNSNSGKRANRTRFTDYQIKVLQEFFENNAYPKDDDLEYLSKLLGLSPRVIVVWFQNARQKARKVYENQPSIESVNTGGRENDESAGRFQRTPSLNYQCKKCLLVFQRYYELIRHQKTHCFKEEDAKRSAQAQAAAAQVAAVFSSEDSNSSSAATTNIFPLNTTTMQIVSDPPLVSGLTNHPNRASSPRHLIQQTCRLEFQEGSYRCDKCDKVFGRFDSWREHQLTHIIDPNLFSLKYPSNSAFGILQQQAINRRSPLLKGSQPSANVNEESKRKLDTYGNNDDSVTKLSSDNIEQPRDKRLRTTILPEQLDFLYQKYQTESNPSRKMLETIAREVGLKKRVVQVWFQNTRARERKGQFRAHNQVINKRCPFCPALFKVKSALESHLNSKHIDQIPRKGINIDSIPDEELSLESSHSSSSAPNTASSIFSPTLADIGAPYKKYYEESMKRYISEMRLHAMNEKRDSKKSSLVVSQTESPLDLSKPVDLSTSVSISATSGFTEDQNNTQRKHSTVEYGLLLESAEKSICDDDSTSGTVEFFDDESDPLSPASSSQGSSKFGMSSFSIFSNSTTYSGANLSQQSGGKRYRTQMSTTQVKVMKSLFSDYKTPTMAECEMLGQEIGLPKRVVQVWFQNARAKEKKAKIAMGSNREGVISHQSPTGPEECKLCCIKYSSKLSIQEHVFTTKHLECVKIAVEDGSLVPPTPGAPSFRESAIANTMDGDLQGNQFQTDENIMYGSLFLHPTVVFQSQHQQQQQHTGNVTTSTTHSTTGESLADLLDS